MVDDVSFGRGVVGTASLSGRGRGDRRGHEPATRQGQRIRHQALLSTEFESLAARGRSATGTGGRTTRISYEDQERGAPQVGSGFSRPNGLPERSLTEEIHVLLGRSRGLERGPVKSSTRGLPTTAPRLSTPPAPLATVRVSRSAVFASPAPQRPSTGPGEQQPSAPQRPSTGSGM